MRTRSLRPVSKNTSCPSVKSCSAPPKRERIRRAAFATPRTLPYSRGKNVTTWSLSPSGKLPTTTAADLPSAISGRQPEAELAERLRILPPVPPHIHRQSQEHLDPEEALQLTPRIRSDPLQHCPALADQDALLRSLFDEDRRTNVEPFRPR